MDLFYYILSPQKYMASEKMCIIQIKTQALVSNLLAIQNLWLSCLPITQNLNFGTPLRASIRFTQLKLKSNRTYLRYFVVIILNAGLT